jgi:glycosyltransferase involved in cell wall biosynthesis
MNEPTGSSSSAGSPSNASKRGNASKEGGALPKLSFGLPVFNGQRSIRRVIDKILAQTFTDFELVISDNHSTDDTAAICLERAAADPRVKFFPQSENAGIVANFNRAFSLSRGQYFRWIGADDWLEANYAEKCVALLDRHPEAIGVTCFVAYWTDAGEKHYAEYGGERVNSPLAHQRLYRCLWLMNEDYRYFDPMYSMHRRAVLERTHRLRPILNGDQMLAAELSLLGPYVHVSECLANRGQPKATRQQVLKLLAPPGHPPIDPNPEQFLRILHELIQAAPLTPGQKLAAYRGVLLYYWEEFETVRIRPVRVVIGNKLRALGIPMDRLSLFR